MQTTTTPRAKRPRIKKVIHSNVTRVAENLAELYNISFKEAMYAYSSQDYNIGRAHMILNLEKRSNENA